MCYRVTAAVAVASAYVLFHAVRLFFPEQCLLFIRFAIFLSLFYALHTFIYICMCWIDCVIVYMWTCVCVCIPLHTHMHVPNTDSFVRCLLLLLLLFFFGAAKIVELKFIYKYFDIFDLKQSKNKYIWKMCLNHIEICMETVDRLSGSHVRKRYDFIATNNRVFCVANRKHSNKSLWFETF